ncbi:siphovirus Gp157 family protein [Ligilactobacillus aviarius]|uniref:siphovirus Gp157 family protein n=1 Tax=Ligilactobacillus aviarius TaxID=1606 RepID=UPI00255BB1A4|nr:siphovirus Gp157 family protein [Ligilactobacillus aviarius]
MNLFELNEKYRELEQRDDLDPETLKDTLDSISDSREVKLDNIANWIENNQANIDFLDKKIKQLQADKKSLVNRTKSLMEYMTTAIDDSGLKELKTENHILKPRNYRASVYISDEKEIPSEFIKFKAVETIDKKSIYELLKNGETVRGAELKPNRKTVIK